MIRVWISGASGFVGRHLAERLLKEGCRVTCLVRKEGATAEKLRRLGAEIVRGDLGQPETFRGSLSAVDWVFHVAAAYRDGGTSRDTFWRVNVEGTRALLDFSSREGVKRFVYCSTVGVHGDNPGRPLNEEDPCLPYEDYGKSKLAAEELVAEAFRQTGLETVILRPVGIYGPGDWRLAKLFASIARKRFVLIGPGRNRYHLTYIDDLVEGFWLCARTAAAAGQTYIIGGGDVPTVAELSREIARQLGHKLPSLHVPFWPVYCLAAGCEAVCRPLGISPPLFRRRLDFFARSRWFDIGKAGRELGYQPRIGLQEGVSRTIEWYRKEGIMP